MKMSPVITKHAIDRYTERVEAGLTQREVVERLADIIESATVRATPRRWMRAAATAAGTRYLYSSRHPDVCLVVAGGAVVTVHSRRICRAWDSSNSRDSLHERRRPVPYQRRRDLPLPEAA